MDALYDDVLDEKLTINKKYANKFQKFKECQELDRLKQKYGDAVEEDGASSTSESEDDDAEALTPQLEEDFMTTLSMIKSKDPQIYEKKTIFYNQKTKDGKNDIVKQKDKKPLFLKDYERERLLKKGSQAYLSESDSDEETKEDTSTVNEYAYNEEQAELRRSIQIAAKEGSDDDEDDLLTVRKKSSVEKKKEDEDYAAWMKKEKKKKGGLFNRYWTEDNLDANEKFLRDYILKKQYKDEDEDRVPTYKEVVGELDTEDEDQEEEELEREEEFERKFNFRFEEPDQNFIKRYPRTVADSVRRQDDKRKMKRKEYEDRKQKEKDKKKEEIKKLKNLKRKEIMSKIDKLKQITGNNKVDVLEDDIDGDFDAAKYDEIMQKVFDNEYYDTQDDSKKPVFSDDEDIDDENWDEWTGNVEPISSTENVTTEAIKDNEQAHCEDDDFNMDADFDPSQVPNKKKRKKMSKFAKAINRKKPLFNPDEKSFEEYLEEYYKLDYEDIIEDLPVRFKYRTVMSNHFGLSTEEILKAEDKELNSWCSLRKTMKYNDDNEELRERAKYKKKARNIEKKKQLFSFLQNDDDENEADENEDGGGGEEVTKSNIESTDKITPSPCNDVITAPSPVHVKVKKIQDVKNLYPKTNKRNHSIQKIKHRVSSKHSIHDKIHSINKKPFKRELAHGRKNVDTFSTTKTKKLRKQFKGGDKELVNKISTSRLAAYGLDKRKKQEK